MTAKLILSLEGSVISEHELNKESISVGRRPDNDIPIDNLAVSGKHCQIITILNDSFLEDLNSTNGTYVNGTMVKKHALKNGDIISIGKHQIKYENKASQAVESEFEKTMIIRPDALGLPANEDAAASAKVNESVAQMEREVSPDAASNTAKAKLQIINGANAGKELALTKALTTIGKPGTQVAAITKRPQGFFIIHVDGGEDNTTPVINGASIGTQSHPLTGDDIIEVAGIKLQFIVE